MIDQPSKYTNVIKQPSKYTNVIDQPSKYTNVIGQLANIPRVYFSSSLNFERANEPNRVSWTTDPAVDEVLDISQPRRRRRRARYRRTSRRLHRKAVYSSSHHNYAALCDAPQLVYFIVHHQLKSRIYPLVSKHIVYGYLTSSVKVQVFIYLG